MVPPVKHAAPNTPAGVPKGTSADWRLRKHAEYQRVYRTGARRSVPLMTFFFSLRPGPSDSVNDVPSHQGPRVGLTVGRVLGKAVDRNRIKRRMREAVRRELSLLQGPVDVVLHPRRSVLDAEFDRIVRDVARAFREIQTAISAPDSGAPAQQHGQSKDAD